MLLLFTYWTICPLSGSPSDNSFKSLYLVKVIKSAHEIKCIYLNLPEQQHECLEESAEVVVVIDSRVLIQFDVAKHLQQSHSEGNGFVLFLCFI